jgi:CRP-like cAMP-binding protein
MKLHVVPPLEVFLNDKVKKPDLYIVLDGKVFLRNKAREESVLETYDIFGYTMPFNSQKWIPSRVTAKDTACIISIPRGPLKKAMEKVKKVQDDTKLLEFLVKTVPGVKQLGQAGKEKILSLFERCEYKNGDVLLKQGDKALYAFIIENGECKVVGSQNPLKRPGSAPSRGLMSKTTSCYNLGVVMPGEWVGEDSILTSKALEFSIIASSHLIALRIHRDKFLEGLTRDTQNTLRENLDGKFKWRELRRQNISHAIIENVVDEEGKAEAISYENAEKNYPKASKLALVKIHNQEYEKVEVIEKNQNAQIFNNFSDENRPKSSVYKVSRPQTGKIRPVSSKTEILKKLGNNPSGSMKNLLYYQPPFQSTNPNLNVPDLSNQNKIQLHSAYTLGYTLVPIIFKRPQTATYKPSAPPAVIKKPTASISLPTTQETFAQKIRKGRPSSPNPAEVWARKQGISIERLSSGNIQYP